MRALIYICSTREENEGKYSRMKKKSGKEYKYIFHNSPLSASKYNIIESYDTRKLYIVLFIDLVKMTSVK